MVDGINTYNAGLNTAGVNQEATVHQKKGGSATEKAQNGSEKTQINDAVVSGLGKKVTQNNSDKQDFISRAEAILNKALTLKTANTKLRIDVDDDSGLFVYKGIDRVSGEVVSQFPAEEILSLISYYREREGIVVDETV